MEVHVVEVPWATHADRLQSIRRAVFIEEQGVPEALEWDGQDDSARHFLALNEAGQSLGAARLLSSRQIGRMAVLPESRSRGIGRRLLDLALSTASDAGMDAVFLHAQEDVVPFYQRAGFACEGEVFLEADIRHQRMTLKLPIPFSAEANATGGARATPSRESFRQDDHPERENWLFEDAAAARAVMQRVISLGRRKLQVLSQDLDHELFDQDDLVEAISAFARAHPATSVQILVFSTTRIVSRGHRLIELARRLPSKVSVRKVARDFASEERSWVVVDDRSIWVLPNHREHDGVGGSFEPVEALRLADAFQYLWERAHDDTELRLLSL